MGCENPRGYHPERGYDRRYFAEIYEAAVDSPDTEARMRAQLEATRGRHGNDHPLIAAKLAGLARHHLAVANYRAAEPLFQESAEVLHRAYGEGHPRYAEGLGKLADFYRTTGNLAAAEPLYQKALEILRAALDSDPLHSTTMETGLAQLYRATGQYGAAKGLLRHVLETKSRELHEHDPGISETVSQLAEVALDSGDYEDAETYFRRAAEIDRAAFGDDDWNVAADLNNLAHVYLAKGDYAAAEPLLRQAMGVAVRALGDRNHPDLSGLLFNLARALLPVGGRNEALLLMTRADAIDDQLIARLISCSAESQRTAVLTRIRSHQDGFLSLILQDQVGDPFPEAVRTAFELVLRRKALGADCGKAERDAVSRLADPSIRQEWQELVALKQTIARMALERRGTHHRSLAELDRELDRKEQQLARRIPHLEFARLCREANRLRVVQALPDGTALVEFARLHFFDFRAVPARGEAHWRPARYLAFVLPDREPDRMEVIDLGDAEPIDRLIEEFRAEIVGTSEDRAGRDLVRRRSGHEPRPRRDTGPALRAAVFDKLVPVLRGRTRLLLAPDGDLCLLPFEVLPTDDGRRLIDDYAVSYLSCGRDVLRFGAVVTGEPGGPLVVADPDFDLDSATSHEPAQPKAGFWSRLLGRGKNATAPPMSSTPTVATTAHAIGRHSRDLDRNRSAYHFHRLPGTREEGERVAALLGAELWLDRAVLESRLKADCRSPHVLHLATHGFFLEDQDHDTGQGWGGLATLSRGTAWSARLAGPLPEDPMLRSGLALAGVNTWLRQAPLVTEAEDGLLTAQDVAGLDLTATELVVLSACETGLGQVHVGEGVYGLRRAFVLAGAKTLVMSLWKVPDEPTRELMEGFYHRLLAGEGRAESLRQAQLGLKAKYPDPYYWGAFICQGDPSPLESFPTPRIRL